MNSNFRAFWLAPLTRNILGYSLFCDQSQDGVSVRDTFERRTLSNKWSSRTKKYQDSDELWLVIRELKNHHDDFVDNDRKWVTVYCASATSKFGRRGVVDDAKQSIITSSCNPQASPARYKSTVLSDFWSPLHFLILVNPGIVPFFLLTSDVDWKFD